MNLLEAIDRSGQRSQDVRRAVACTVDGVEVIEAPSRACWWNWCHGKAAPNDGMRRRIASVLGVAPDGIDWNGKGDR